MARCTQYNTIYKVCQWFAAGWGFSKVCQWFAAGWGFSKVCQWFAAGWGFSQCSPVSSTHQ